MYALLYQNRIQYALQCCDVEYCGTKKQQRAFIYKRNNLICVLMGLSPPYQCLLKTNRVLFVFNSRITNLINEISQTIIDLPFFFPLHCKGITTKNKKQKDMNSIDTR